MNEEDFEIVTCMKEYGGSFVKALAECFFLADSINFVKLQLAFPEYWEQYKNFNKE